MLYIFRFLHQTTTPRSLHPQCSRCISFVSYIKPQLDLWNQRPTFSCISFVSYIKPQQYPIYYKVIDVVYLSFPTSNHNFSLIYGNFDSVVYLSFPTSNHNPSLRRRQASELYIFRFLHQTTTLGYCLWQLFSCISFVSYIKPQHTPVSQPFS